MPWQALRHMTYAIATSSFSGTKGSDELPVQLGDELYVFEQGGKNGDWYRGYIMVPPSLLGGLTSVRGETLEPRVYTGTFPKSCVEVREEFGREGLNGANGDGVEGTEYEQDENADPESDGKTLRSPTMNGVNGIRKPKKRASLALIKQSPPDPKEPKPFAPVPMLKVGDETPYSNTEPLVDEISSCLKEWHSRNLHELILSKEYPMLDQMFELVPSLDLARRQLMHNVLTAAELRVLREKVVWDLVRGNKIFNGEVTVRDPEQNGRILRGDDSAVEITKLQSMMSLLDERPQHAIDNLTLHHLFVDVKTFVGTSTESTTLEFFLASKIPGQAAVAVSESYIVEAPPSGSITTLASTVNMRTLFADLAGADIGDTSAPDNELFLVVKVRATQQVIGGRPESRAGPDMGSSPSFGTNSIGRAGRRSLMWGNTAKRNAVAKNPPLSSRMGQLTEVNENGRPLESRDGPPQTANSQMSPNERKSSVNSRIVTRTVSVGAVKVNTIMKDSSEDEQAVTFWSPAASSEEYDRGESWQEVVKDLMDSKSGQFEKSRRGERLLIFLKSFSASDATDLIKTTPTLLSGVCRTSKMGFSGAPTKPRSDIYITLNEAFLPRQALLSRSSGSATALANHITGSNLQITLEVRKANGERYDSCIFPSSNAESQFMWESTATERGAGWSQNVKLIIPTADVAGCHIVMTLADAPSGPFAISYMPLFDQQAFIRDGHHSLLLYKYDDTTNTAQGRGQVTTGYLNLPWNARGKDDVSKDEAVTGPIATVRVQTYLCSTQLTQDKVLLGLLKWKEHPSPEVQTLLKRLDFVPEIEIVKLLSDVFDAIFGILVEQSGNDEYEDLVFGGLITVLGIVHDRRFNLGPLVDHYAETQFCSSFAAPCLIRSFSRLLAKPSETETSRKLRATLKVVRHVLKFITHARGQQLEKEANIGITGTSTTTSFNRDLRNIFKALDELMRNPSPVLVGTQTLAIQHFHTWLPELSGLLTTEETVHVAIDFMDSCSGVQKKLILYKLVLIINYSKLELFSQPEQREALCMNTVRWIAPHWGKTDLINDQWRDQVRLCCSILSTQVQTLANEIPDYIPKIIDSYLGLQSRCDEVEQDKTRLSLLFPASYPFPTKPITSMDHFDEALIELSSILSAISASGAGLQLELDEDEPARLLQDILEVHYSILDNDAFPANWLSLHLYHHQSTIKTLEIIANILLEQFLPHPDNAEEYNTELWKSFFKVLFKLVSSDVLSIEEFTDQKRRAAWHIGGDIRETGGELLRRIWETNGWDVAPDDEKTYGLSKWGGYQVQFVPEFVGPILELCLSVHEGLRAVAVEMLQSMIISEWELNEDISAVQTEMIECLDHLLKTKSLNDSTEKKIFMSELTVLFDHLADIPDHPLYAAVMELADTMDEYLDLLIAVYGAEYTGEASQLIHRLALMEFLRDMQKEGIFIRYVHQLAELQFNAGNFTEAGLALRLHADLYDWNPTKIVPAITNPDFPAQSSFDRKERIYFEVIKHFEDGEAWSSALEVYEELQSQYMDNTYDYHKLVRTQRAIATIYESISRAEKVARHYFRVSYRGMGFSNTLRDKDFIFEGSPTEKVIAFKDRLQAQHPAAHMLDRHDEIPDVEGQFLIVSTLTPHKDQGHHVFQRARVPNIVREYLLSIHPNTFSYTSGRLTKGPVTEQQSEKMVFTTQDTFPTILRRSEVISVQRVALGPQETALDRICRRTAELASLEKKVGEGTENLAHTLITNLNIACKARSDDSMSSYRLLIPVAPEPTEQAIEEEHEASEAEMTSLENALKTALIDHAVVIKRCLTMLSKPDREHLMGEQEREALTEHFESTYQPELLSFGFPAWTPSRIASPTGDVTGDWSQVPLPLSADDNLEAAGDDPAVRGLPRNLTRSSLTSPNGSVPNTRRRSVNGRNTPPPSLSGHGRKGSKRLSFLHKQQGSVSYGQADVGTILSPIKGSEPSAPNVNVPRGSLSITPLSYTISRENETGSGFSPITPVKQSNTFPNRNRQQSNASEDSKGNVLSRSLSVKSSDGNSTKTKTSAKNRTSSFFSPIGGSLGRNNSRSGYRGNYGVDENSDTWMTEAADMSRTSTNMLGDSQLGGEVKAPESQGGGSIRKRLSMLRLGKKTSKMSVMAGGIAEED